MIESERGLAGVSTHYQIFRRSRSVDDRRLLATYRNRADAILMHVRGNPSRFCGKVGRVSAEREVTRYREEDDEAETALAPDNDIPHVAFLCCPPLGMLACEDHPIEASSAMGRLHAILYHRQQVGFLVDQIATASDLRIAANSFKLFKVSFDVERVNPHTGDLGRILDENNKRDNIQRLRGQVESDGVPLRIHGGTLEQVQQLQQSGHARVGYEGLTPTGTLVSVKKTEIADEEAESPAMPAVRVRFQERPRYPFTAEFMEEMESIMKSFGGATSAKE